MKPRKPKHPPVEVLWCPNRTRKDKNKNGWSFPREVEMKIREITAGGSVLHPFGGLSKFGTRVDIDSTTRPHVMADAWMLPFAAGSFDFVVLDPPYLNFSREVLFSLLYSASYVARDRVIWLGHIWSPSGAGLRLERAWLCRCGDSLIVRALQVFKKTERVIYPMKRFARGPQMKYNRWLIQPHGLPFGKLEAAGD